MNNNTRTIRSEEITIDMRVLTIMEDGRKNGEIYLAAIAPDMELTVITLDEAPDILPCFDEDDACVNIPDSTLMLCYNPAQVLELGGKHYLTGPVILMRIDIFGCGIYTAYCQHWTQFFILLVAEFACFILFFGATAITEGIQRFSEWIWDII